MAASHSVFLGWGTSISPHETGRYHTVLLSSGMETLYDTADTLSFWADLIRNIPWEACRCDGLHYKGHGRMWPVGCSRCHCFSPGQIAKGFGGYCLSFCGSTRVLLEGLRWQEDFKRKSTCSVNKFALSATQRLCLHRPLYYKGMCKWRGRDELRTSLF